MKENINQSFEKAKFEIIELSPDDWQKLQDLKMKSLNYEPIAFEDQEGGMKRYSARPEDEWRRILSGKLIDKEGSYVNVFAKSEDKIIGMVAAIVPGEPDEKNKIATLHHMYVDPDWRGQKIGKELLQAILNKLKLQGNTEKIMLNVVATQIPALEMYKGLGFQEIGRKIVKRGQGDYEEIGMELKIIENKI